MSLLDKILLNETYVYRGDISVLNAKLKKHKKNKRIGKRTFKTTANTSIGILQGSNGMSLDNSIQVNFEVKESNSLKHYVHFSSTLRVEHYFFVFLFSIFFIGSFFLIEQAWFLPILTLLLWSIFHLTFHFILRVQEEDLMEEIVKLLSLKKIKP